MNKNLKQCVRCIMDTSDHLIIFDDKGICNHCKEAIRRLKNIPITKKDKKKLLSNSIKKIKKDGIKLEYDCVIGLSGGLDSSFLAYKVKKLGLRPLAVHVDNGWNTEISVSNINNLVKKLNIDLITEVLEWNSFKDLQLSFLKSSLANCEAPTDHAITASLFKNARKFNVKYIISGSNLATESIMPKSWGHYNQDLKLLKNIHKIFGKKKLVNFPTISILQYFYYIIVLGIKQIPLLNFMDYKKEDSLITLQNEFNFKKYKYKHGESIWTRFFQNYYLPKKFSFDKRKAHLSSMICSKQITRSDALQIMRDPLYTEVELKKDFEFILKKFDLNKKQFDDIINLPGKKVSDYPSHEFLFEKFEFLKNIFRSYATKV